jgi:hypothetical protein
MTIINNDREDKILNLILTDMAEQNISPGRNYPVATIQQRALSKGITDMSELVNALNLGVKYGFFLRINGGPKGLGSISLTGEGYSEATKLTAPVYTSDCPFPARPR